MKTKTIRRLEKATTLLLLVISVVSLVWGAILLDGGMVAEGLLRLVFSTVFIGLFIKLCCLGVSKRIKIAKLEGLDALAYEAFKKCEILRANVLNNTTKGYGQEKYDCLSEIEDVIYFLGLFDSLDQTQDPPSFYDYYYALTLTDAKINDKFERCEKSYKSLMFWLKNYTNEPSQ